MKQPKTKAPTPAQRKFVSRTISHWKPKLFLHEWDITAEFHTKDTSDNGATADCSPDPKYLRAVIRIFGSYWKLTHKEKQEFIVHELCHCHTEPLYLLIRELWCDRNVTQTNAKEVLEQTTQRIANIAFQEEK